MEREERNTYNEYIFMGIDLFFCEFLCPEMFMDRANVESYVSSYYTARRFAFVLPRFSAFESVSSLPHAFIS